MTIRTITLTDDNGKVTTLFLLDDGTVTTRRPLDNPADDGWEPMDEEVRLIATQAVRLMLADEESFPEWEELPALTLDALARVHEAIRALRPLPDEMAAALYRRASEDA